MADVLTRRRRGDARSRGIAGRVALTAAAQILAPSRQLRLQNYEWQREAWNFYRTLGAFKYSMLWFSQTMSRVRLTAAIVEPGGSEPTPLTDGPAAELMRQFFGGPSGQSQYMRSMATQLNVPGEGYVVAEDDVNDEDGGRSWSVKSTSEIQVTSGRAMVDGRMKAVDLWKILIDESVWRTLPFETHVFKQWRPDEEFSFRADSPARAALMTMRTIDMMERRIVAQAVSRLASNGVLYYPQEVTFPPKPGFENAADPFTAEWLDIAGKTIENPGSALAALPLPVKVPREYIKDFVHQDFSNTYDEKTLEILRFEYDLLATAMNMPKEVVTGMGSTSHWNAWALDEQGIKVHIAPEAELITQGVTKGYLHPALRSVGEKTVTPDGELIVWYDTSELVQPPDMSAAADAAFDRQQINSDAYRRNKGFDQGDKPTKPELREQLLLQMAKDPTQAPVAIEELTGTPVAGASTGPGGVDVGAPASQPTPATGPPPKPTEQPAEPPPPVG